MTLTERSVRDITILRFGDRLTFTAGAELSRRISVLAIPGRSKVVLNLSRVSYIDSPVSARSLTR